MSRLGCFVVLLLVPALTTAAEKPKQKIGFLGIQVAKGKAEGSVMVMSVFNDSPAEKAGLKPGDRLLRIDGAKPASLVAAVTIIRALKPGKKVTLTVERDGKEKTLEAVPGSLDG